MFGHAVPVFQVYTLKDFLSEGCYFIYLELCAFSRHSYIFNDAFVKLSLELKNTVIHCDN